MLTNILNTIAIACSLGTSILNTNQKKLDVKPNRDVLNFTTEEYTLTNSVIKLLEFETPTTNNYFVAQVIIQDYTLYTGYVQAQMRRITLMPIKREGQTDTAKTGIYYNNQIRPQPTFTEEYNSGDYPNTPYVQQITFIKVASEQNLASILLNTNEYVYLSENYVSEQTTANYYREILSTTTNLDSYIDYNANYNSTLMFSKYTLNNNFYDLFNRIKLNEVGYTSSISTDSGEIDDDTIEKSYNTIYTNGKTNYYVLYEQPQYYIDNDPGENVIHLQYNPYNIEGGWDSNEELLNNYQGKRVIGQINTEVIDVPGVMFTVLGMPFTFISTAFNLTIFPGTAYEVNISYLFLAIIAVLIFVWLLKIIINRVN